MRQRHNPRPVPKHRHQRRNFKSSKFRQSASELAQRHLPFIIDQDSLKTAKIIFTLARRLYAQQPTDLPKHVGLEAIVSIKRRIHHRQKVLLTIILYFLMCKIIHALTTFQK